MIRGGHIGKFSQLTGAMLFFDHAIREKTCRVPDRCQVGKKIGDFFKIQSPLGFKSRVFDYSRFIDQVNIIRVAQGFFNCGEIHCRGITPGTNVLNKNFIQSPAHLVV